MKSSFIPVSCGVVLAAISAAGTSHWFSVREMVLAYSVKNPVPLSPAPETDRKEIARTEPKPAPLPAPKPAKAPQPAPVSSPAAAVASSSSEEFFRSLVQEFKDLKNENRNLQDQLEETNRDLMNLQFRVDTHSTQFRPLPMMNDLRSLENQSREEHPDHGVLPPMEGELLPESR